MYFLDLSNDPGLPVLLEMLPQMTRTDNSRDTLTAFFARYSRVRPIDHYVGCLPDPNDPGAFRVLYDVSASAIASGEARHDRDLSREGIQRRPKMRGGFLGEMMGVPAPRLALDIDITADPILGDRVAGMRSCMALPLFQGPDVVEWTFAFSKQSTGFVAQNVTQATMTANLLAIANRNLDSLREIKRLNIQLSDQFEQIAKLQQALLPSSIPDIPGLEIATSYLTSDQAGGDYYDFFALPDGRWGILIADVSGHGPAAATVMAMLHAILHSFGSLRAEDAASPARTLAFANDRLCAAGLEGSFVTAFLAVYSPHSGAIEFASAGHPPPRLLRHGAGRVLTLEDAAAVPLGIVDAVDFESRHAALQPGDTLVLYTDGITELFGPDRSLFGVDRLDASLRQTDGSPDAIIDAVYASLFRYRGQATRDDDQTLVALRHHGVCRVDPRATP